MNSRISVKNHACRLIGVTALVLFLIPAASAFQFYLHSGERRCFTESVPPNTKVLGEYTVSTGTGNMEVDISVKVPEENVVLYHKRNIDHGKFAFVVPFRDSHAEWRIHAAEMLRKRMQHKVRDVFNQHPSTAREDNHRRRLLSSGHTDHVEQIHRDNTHERQFDEHGRAQPPTGHVRDQKSDVHDSDYRNAHHESHHHGSEDSHPHHYHDDTHHHHDDDDYFFDDDVDDFDIDDYDGIGDEELDDEMAQEEAAHIKEKGTFDAVSDIEREAELFESRKFEICISSDGAKDAHKRRVRLIIHKGEAAHDYTRLAKKDHMTKLEVSVRRVSEELHELMHELEKARQMEDSLRRNNENTNRRVVILAIVSMVSLAGVGSYQAMYTKRFLKRKKIL